MPDKILCSIVSICVLDHAQTTIDFEMCRSNRNVPLKIFNCSVNNKTKDCAFQTNCSIIVFLAKFHTN